MKKPVVGILGAGEVGQTVSKIFSKKYSVLKKDLNYDELKKFKIEVLHVCLPYNNKFETIVLAQIKKNKPKLAIIHSTVKPGTTAKIFKKAKIPTVHSPVMGTHPNLESDILKFVKIIGPEDRESAKLAVNHLKSVGIKSRIFRNSLESEIAKLFDTTYYGWNIIFSKIVWQVCKKAGVNFENVYTNLNKIYNEGYRESKENVIRPILNYQPGPIGGHCVVPNAKLLHSSSPNIVSKTLIAENKKF